MKQFDESKHPRDEAGKFTDGVGTKAEQERLEQMGISVKDKKQDTNLTNEEKRLRDLTGEKTDKELTEEEKKKELMEVFYQELKNKVQNLKPVPQKIEGKEVLIEFDEHSAGKNINKKRFNSSRAGNRWKKDNIDKWREMLKNASFAGNAPEKGNKLDKNGKIKIAHDGVKEWFYFKGKRRDETGNRYKYKFHIRSKGDRFFVYELEVQELKRKKNKQKEPS